MIRNRVVCDACGHSLAHSNEDAAALRVHRSQRLGAHRALVEAFEYAVAVSHVVTKAAGGGLDGRIWDRYPQVVTT